MLVFHSIGVIHELTAYVWHEQRWLKNKVQLCCLTSVHKGSEIILRNIMGHK